MLTRTAPPSGATKAAPAELAAVADLMAEAESPVGDAPQHCQPSGLLLSIVLSPKAPKEKEKNR